MSGQPGLIGEIHEDEIVKIARKAADERGYAIYRDFDEYMEQKKVQKKLKFRRGGWHYLEILNHLEDAGWKHIPGWSRDPARFYPPGQ